MFAPRIARRVLCLTVLLGCVADDWTFPTSRAAPDASDASDGASADAPDSALDCQAGQSACGGACVGGPSALYSADDNLTESTGRFPAAQARMGVGYAPGHLGRAFNLTGNGAMQPVVIPSEVTDFADSQFTVTLWFKTSRDGNLLAKRPTCSPGTFVRGVDLRVRGNGTPYAELWTTDRHYQLGSTRPLNDGVWHQIALVNNNGMVGLNVDGRTEAMDSGSQSINSANISSIYVGVGPCVRGAPVSDGTTDGTDWFFGQIDEIAFYQRAMSERELSDRTLGRCAP